MNRKRFTLLLLGPPFFLAGGGCDFTGGGGGDGGNEPAPPAASSQAERPVGTGEIWVGNNGPVGLQLFIDGFLFGDILPGAPARFVVPAGQQTIALRRVDGVQVTQQTVNLQPNSFLRYDLAVNGQLNVSGGSF